MFKSITTQLVSVTTDIQDIQVEEIKMSINSSYVEDAS